MKKVTVSLPQGDWGTLKTKYPRNSDQVKFTEFTGSSQNFDTEIAGVITKRRGGVNFNATLLPNPPADLYEAIFSDGTHHMLEVDGGTLSYSSGGGIMNTVTSGYSSTGNMEFGLYQNRVYFGNGIDSPQSYDTTTTYGGVTYTAPKTKAMGCQVPTAPSVILLNNTSAIPPGAHTYKITYLYYGSEESNGSPASSVMTTDASHQVQITLPIGGYGVTARKVYRDNNDGNYLLIQTISDNTTTLSNDNVAAGTTPIPLDNGLPPTFSKILQHLDRLWVAGVSGNTSTIYFSAAGMPDIFNATGYVLCNPRDPIVGLAVYNDQVLVFNRNSLGFIIGHDTATFAYSEIPTSIGCVDNRSIQIRTSSGIPTIVWLSDKGFYEFNGSSIKYISDPIEDQVNLNIQQALQVKGKNTQSTQAAFNAGTLTPAVTVSSGGVVSQANPKKTFQVLADYLTGTSTGMELYNSSNLMEAPTYKILRLANGTYNNTYGTTSLVLPTSVDYTGNSSAAGGEQGVHIMSNTSYPADTIAQSVIVPRAGTVTNIQLEFVYTSNSGTNGTLFIWADSGGTPGSSVYSTPIAMPTATTATLTVNVNPGIHLAAGTYWFGVQCGSTGAVYFKQANLGLTNYGLGTPLARLAVSRNGFGVTGWTSLQKDANGNPAGSLYSTFAFTSDAVAAAGTWTSETYDTLSDTTSPVTLIQTGTYPTGCSATTVLEGSNDQSTWDVSTTTANINGTVAESMANRRYWRVRTTLNTTDDRNTPSLSSPNITFPTSVTWVSPAIAHTTDITALNSLTYTSSVPTGTSLTVQIATSADNITYSAYTAIGSAVAQAYSKIKVTITTDSGNTVTAQISNIVLSWTVVSTLTSSAIDTGATPVGWELFQDSVGTLGTVTFQVRTATTSGGLTAASWVNVTNGAYITAAVNRWVQWKAVLTSTADNAATLTSVTINWFISKTNAIRVASIFYGRAYYMAASEFGQTTNNLIFKLDEFGRWRVYRGISIGTLTFFFTQPYYGSATTGQIVNWLTGTTDSGTNIALDIQTAAVNYEDLEHNKILRKVRVIGANTGATYTPQYSTDNGLTWKSMVNPITGLTTYTTSTNGGLFDVRFQPIFASDNATGITHVFRLTSSDAFTCQIHGIKMEAWIRQGDI